MKKTMPMKKTITMKKTMPMKKTMTMKWMSNMKNSGYLLLPITDLFFKLEDLILQNLQRESFSKKNISRRKKEILTILNSIS